MRIGGLASGMDTDQLVKDLMKAEKMPLDKLTQQKIWTEWQQEAYRETNLALSSLRTSAGSLRFQSSFNSFSATSSNTASLTATANTNALNGTYSVEVLSVARSAKTNSANAIQKADGTAAKAGDQIGTAGTITVRDSAGVETAIEITATMTYKDVAAKLQTSTAGTSTELRANFDDTTSRFFVSSKGMGENQNFTLEFSTPELANQVLNDGGATSVSTTNATNGSLNFDGILVDGLTTNQTVVNGLTLNLNKIGSSTVTVKSDPAASLESIKGFVEEYNKTIGEMETQLIQKRYPDFQPLNDEQKAAMSEREIELWEEKARSGLLRNDPILKSALTDLRRAFMDPVEGIANGNINMLSQIGISTGDYKEGGKLFIDEEKLKDALMNKPDEVIQLFTNRTGGLGIGERVYQELNSAVKNLSNRAGSPGSFIDNSTISKRLDQMTKEIDRWQDRLVKVEDRYWRQFSAMEKALNQMNQQSVWMQQNMFGGM